MQIYTSCKQAALFGLNPSLSKQLHLSITATQKEIYYLFSRGDPYRQVSVGEESSVGVKIPGCSGEMATGYQLGNNTVNVNNKAHIVTRWLYLYFYNCNIPLI